MAKQVASLPTIESFVYISAADVFPLINPRYITSKREAERYLFSRPEFKSIIFRPGKDAHDKIQMLDYSSFDS